MDLQALIHSLVRYSEVRFWKQSDVRRQFIDIHFEDCLSVCLSVCLLANLRCPLFQNDLFKQRRPQAKTTRIRQLVQDSMWDCVSRVEVTPVFLLLFNFNPY